MLLGSQTGTEVAAVSETHSRFWGERLDAWHASAWPGGVDGAQIRSGPNEGGHVAPAAVLEGVVGGNLDDDVGLDPHDVDVLAAPVADVAAADHGRPRMVVAGRDEKWGKDCLLHSGEGGGTADDVEDTITGKS